MKTVHAFINIELVSRMWGIRGSQIGLSIMLKTITVSPRSKNPASPGDSRFGCQAECSIISAGHAASCGIREPVCGRLISL